MHTFTRQHVLLLLHGLLLQGTATPDHHVFFKERGITITSQGAIHVAVSLDFTEIEENLLTVLRFTESMDAWLAYAAQGGGLELARCRDEIKKLLSKIRAYQQLGEALSTRDKRFLGLLLGAVGTLWGAYNTGQINQLQAHQETQATAISDLFHEVDVQHKILNKYGLVLKKVVNSTYILAADLTSFEKYKQAVDMITSLTEGGRMQVQDAAAMIDGLMQQRLSVACLNPGEMRTLLRGAQTIAQEKGYTLLARSVADAYQTRTSFRTNGSHITAIVHLPLEHTEDELQVLEHIPVPVEVEKGVFMTVLPEHAVIATDHNRTTFVTMTLTTLSACSRQGAYYLCDEINTKHRMGKVRQYHGERDATMCTWFLLTEDIANVRKACPIMLHQAQSEVFQVSGTEFIFVEEAEHMAKLECRGQKAIWQRLTGATRVTVPAGCQFTSDTSIATGRFDTAGNSTVVSYAWNLHPSQLVAELDLPRYKQLMDQVSTDVDLAPRDSRDVARWMAAQDNWNSHKNITISSVGTWVAVIVLLVVVFILAGLMCVIKKKMAQKKKAIHNVISLYNPMAPPAATGFTGSMNFNTDRFRALLP